MPNRKEWTTGEIRELKENYPKMNTTEVARNLNRSVYSVRGKAVSLGIKKDLNHLRKQKMEGEVYAMYKGDDLLVVGTLEEIADHQNMTIDNVRFMAYPSYHKRSSGRNRRLVFKLEE